MPDKEVPEGQPLVEELSVMDIGHVADAEEQVLNSIHAAAHVCYSSYA